MSITQSSKTDFQPGAVFEGTIQDIAFGGEGVARINDYVVFVPFVLLGEEVRFELVEVKKHFGRGRLLEVLQPSPQRVTAPCPYFGGCGGCQYQHIAYPAQLELKQKQIVDLLQRVGGFKGVMVDAVIPSPRQYGYRNRIMVRTQWNKPEQRLNLGFLRWDNRLVEDIEECKIAEPALNRELQKLRKRPPPKGGIKVVLRNLPEGWHVPPASFFQNNSYLLPELVRVLRERLRESKAEHLIDAYCGVGYFSLELAGEFQSAVGIEMDLQAIQAARLNAAQREASHVRFLHGKTEEILPSALKEPAAGRTCVLLDPPRTGCPPAVIEQVRLSSPGVVLYVSCYPATLARDLKAFCADDLYKIERVTPLDMFPQTQHVECVAALRASGLSSSDSV